MSCVPAPTPARRRRSPVVSTPTPSPARRRRSPRKERPYLLTLKPSQKAKRPRSHNPAEWFLQCAVAGFLDLHPRTRATWFHYPAGGFRNKNTARWLKKTGAKPGVPDVMIFQPFTLDGRTYNGLAIELKKLGANGPSVCQDHWLRTLHDTCGWLCAVGRTFKDVRALIERVYGPLPPLAKSKAPPVWLSNLWLSEGFNVADEIQREGSNDASTWIDNDASNPPCNTPPML